MRRSGPGPAGLLLGLLVSALALAFVLRWAGWEPLRHALAGAEYVLLLPAVGIFLISMAARALAWRTLLDDRPTLLQTLAALNQGYLLNNLLPWRLGEVGRAVLLGRKPGLTTGMVLSSILLERILDILLAVGLLLALGPLTVRAEWAPRTAAAASLALLAALSLVAVLFLRPAALQGLLTRLPWGGAGAARALENLNAGLSALRSPRRALAAGGWMALSWGLAAVEYWVVLRAFVPEAALSWAALALCVSALGAAVPSAPGFWGVFEASAVAALALVGVATGPALGFALLLHAVHMVITCAFGALALGGEGETLAGLARAARQALAPRPAPSRRA